MRRAAIAAVLASALAAGEPAAGAAPGLAAPAAAAPAGAWQVLWGGDHRTWIVVAPGLGRTRAAWVSTSEVVEGGDAYRVAYPALAWCDAAGTIHVHARGARVVGPQAFDPGGRRRWYPDSFAIHPDGRVEAQDEQPEAPIHDGRVVETIDAAADPAAWRSRRDAVAAMAGNQG